MRLIDADALKEKSYRDEFAIDVVTVEDIDNAPTVEPEKAKEGELVKAYTKGFDAGVETARPQGEWIKHCPCSSGGWWIRCSECGTIDKSDESKTINYCWNCGAEMREGDKYD